MPDWLDTSAPSIAKVLKNAGYTTVHFGKWHLTNSHIPDAPEPSEYGFDDYAVFNGPEGTATPRNRLWGAAAPFRGRKRSLYEGGVRVPGLVEWPVRITEGRQTDMPVVTSDILPTLLDAVGVTLPTDRPYDGASLLDVIDGADRARGKAIGFQYIGYSSWVTDRYKLVHNLPGKRHRSDTSDLPISLYELYDLESDPSETNNIAAENPAIVASLRSELEAWQASVLRSAAGGDY